MIEGIFERLSDISFVIPTLILGTVSGLLVVVIILGVKRLWAGKEEWLKTQNANIEFLVNNPLLLISLRIRWATYFLMYLGLMTLSVIMAKEDKAFSVFCIIGAAGCLATSNFCWVYLFRAEFRYRKNLKAQQAGDSEGEKEQEGEDE